jgi:hypothetical protein
VALLSDYCRPAASRQSSAAGDCIVSVEQTAIAQRELSWSEISEIAPLPVSSVEFLKWDFVAKKAGREARAEIWGAQNNSKEFVQEACRAALMEWGDEYPRKWHTHLYLALHDDRLTRDLPTLEGIEFFIEYADAWWPEYWARQDKEDLEGSLSLTEGALDFETTNWANQSEKELGSLVWLERLRKRFPGYPVTQEELRHLQEKRRIAVAAELHSANLCGEAKQVFDELVERMKDGWWKIPVSGNAVEEVNFFKDLMTVELDKTARARVFAALLHTAATLDSDRPRGRTEIHPIHGYAIRFGTRPQDPNEVVGAAPGLLRLQIEGEQYLLTCELWPAPVVMSPNEFGRARGSANAILRDVGIAVDSPPGLWKAVWEAHGLRNQLLATAERIDPRVRIEEFKAWIRRIALAAPAADRPPTNGAAVRLADGATVASRQWLIGQAMADGVVRPHEQSVFEQIMRENTRETNRRNANRVQQRLLTIDAVGEPAGNPLINARAATLIENHAEA